MALLEKLPPSRVLTLGFFLIAIANIGSYVVQRKLHLSESLSDGISGFLMGVAITTMLIGVWMQGRQRRGRGRLG